MSQPINLRRCHRDGSVELACCWHRTRNIAPSSEEAEARPDGSARTASSLAKSASERVSRSTL
jgi:hypothetical protein